jgi:hypothetical protein
LIWALQQYNSHSAACGYSQACHLGIDGEGHASFFGDAFQQAIALEKIQMPLKVNLPLVKEINEDQDTTELGGEIEALRAQLNQIN